LLVLHHRHTTKSKDTGTVIFPFSDDKVMFISDGTVLILVFNYATAALLA